MIDFQSLTNLPEINFKSKDRPELQELAEYIDHMKADLFNDRWSQATKKHIKTSLVLYIRSMQKQLAPMGYHYPFRRYLHAGYTKVIKDVRGNDVDLNNHSIRDHFKMLGQSVR